MDDKDVQQEQVSEETVSKDTEPVKEEVKPLTEERMQQLFAEESEKIKRTFQSEKDKAILQIQREADTKVRRVEMERDAIKSGVSRFDPEGGQDLNQTIRQSELEAQNQYYSQESQQREMERQNLEAYGRFKTGISNYAESQGIDPKGIDWKDGTSETLFEKNERVLSEIGKNQAGVRKKAEDDMKLQFEDMERKLRIDLGMETQTKEGPSITSDDDANFKKGVGDGSIDITTKENWARVKKLGLA